LLSRRGSIKRKEVNEMGYREVIVAMLRSTEDIERRGGGLFSRRPILATRLAGTE
jgi:hypothetical protein